MATYSSVDEAIAAGNTAAAAYRRYRPFDSRGPWTRLQPPAKFRPTDLLAGPDNIYLSQRILRNPVFQQTMASRGAKVYIDRTNPVEQVGIQKTGEQYWENPQRIARYYNAARNLPPGSTLPTWFDNEGVEMGYNILKAYNGDKPWYLWQKLPDDDPVREFFPTIGMPPPQAMPTNEANEFYSPAWRAPANNDLIPMGIDQVDGLPPELLATFGRQGDKYLVPSNFLDQYAVGDRGFSLDQQLPEDLPAWQRNIIKASPWLNTAISGLGGLVTGAFVGGPVGAAIGGVGGVALGLYMQDEQKKAQLWAQENNSTVEEYFKARPTLTQAMMVLDWPAQQLEQSAGLLGQIMASIEDPERYGPVQEVLNNLEAAYKAGQLAYDVASVGPDVRTSGTGEVTIKAYNLGVAAPDTWTIKGSPSSWALTEARRRIMRGESPEQVTAEIKAKFGIAGDVRDLIGHMFLDPLNMMGDVINAGGYQFAKAADNATLADAFRLRSQIASIPEQFRRGLRGQKLLEVGNMASNDVVDALRIYGQRLRQMPIEDAVKFGAVSRWLAGLDKMGNIKELRAGDRVGIIDYLRGLTPQARAHEVLTHSVDGLQTLLREEDNPARMVGWVQQISGMSPQQAVDALEGEVMPNWFRSAEGQSTVLALRDLRQPTQEMWDLWRTTRDQATIIQRVADSMGIDPYELMGRLHRATPEKANDLYRAFLQSLEKKAAGDLPNGIQPDAEAARVLKMIREDQSLGRLTGSKLKEIGATFTVGNAPFDNMQFRSQFFHLLTEGVENWAVRNFKVRPPHWAVRTGNLVKRAQGLVLLGLNPNFLINNALNNMVTMGWDGLLGFAPARTRMKWLREMGIKPVRLRSGATAAEIGDTLLTAGDLGGYELGKGIRRASRAGDVISAMDDFARGTDRFAVFAQLSQRMERWSSELSMVNAMRQFWDQTWVEGRAITSMPADLEAALEAFSPGMAKKIKRAIANGKTKTQLDKILFQDLGQPRLGDVLSPTERGLLDHFPGLVDDMDQKLAQATTPNQVRTVFSEARKRVQDEIQQQIQRNMARITQEAANKVKIEGGQGMLDLFDLHMQERHDFWLQHFDKMNAVAEEAARHSGEMRRQIWRRGLDEADRDWQAFENVEGSKWLGAFEGMSGSLDNPVYVDALSTLTNQHNNWSNFYQRRRELMDQFFTQSEGMDDAGRSELWHQTNQALNREYTQAILIEDELQVHIDELFSDLYAAQFPDNPQAFAEATNWRLAIRDVRRRMAATQMLMRDGGVMPADVMAAWGDLLPPELVQRVQNLTKLIPPYAMGKQQREQVMKSFMQDIYAPYVREMLEASNRNTPGHPLPPEPPIVPGTPPEAPVTPIVEPAAVTPEPAVQAREPVSEPQVPRQEPVRQPTPEEIAAREADELARANQAGVFKVAAEYGIGSITPGDRKHILNILKQLYNVTDISQVTDEMARDAFARRAQFKGAIDLPAQQALDRKILEFRAEQMRRNQAAMLPPPRRFTRDALFREAEAKLGSEKAADIMAIEDAKARYWAEENGRSVDDWYDQQMWAVGGIEAGPGLEQIIPETPEFRAFFKESKVVDRAGRPQVMYHGTRADFNVFQPGDAGMHFGTDVQAEGALRFRRRASGAINPGENVIPVYLSVQNPLRTEDLGTWSPESIGVWLMNHGHERQGIRLYGLDKEILSRYSRGIAEAGNNAEMIGKVYDQFRLEQNRAIKTALAEIGYDGIVYRNEFEGVGDSWLVFDSTQIKSVFNTGSFDPNNPNILQQAQKGLTRFLDNGQAFINIFELGDESSFVHESSHFWLPMMGQRDVDIVSTWLRAEYGLDLPEGWQYGHENFVQAKEYFARGFERYLAEGRAPIPSLKRVFENFKKWLLNIYGAITGSDIDVKLNDNIIELFDRWMGKKRVDQMTTDEMRTALLTDELTAIPNRRAYNEAQKLPVQVVLDVEGLKYVNDNYGHAAGDEVINALANAIRQTTEQGYRGSNRGDEFIMQFNTQEDAQQAVENVTRLLAEYEIRVNGEPYRGLGVSTGIGKSLEEADLQLNRNKEVAIQEGRRANRGEKPVNLVPVQPAAAPPEMGVPARVEPWQMTRVEFTRLENEPKLEAIQNAIREGKRIQIVTQYRAWNVTDPADLRIGRDGMVYHRSGKSWNTLTTEQVDRLAAQAGMKVPGFDEVMYHRAEVQKAIDTGLPVPEEVLADYPGITKTEALDEFGQPIEAIEPEPPAPQPEVTVPPIEPIPAQTRVMNIDIRRNEAQGGIEVKFDEKPSQSTIDTLKSMGYRWSSRNKVWYKKEKPGDWDRLGWLRTAPEEARTIVEPERWPTWEEWSARNPSANQYQYEQMIRHAVETGDIGFDDAIKLIDEGLVHHSMVNRLTKQARTLTQKQFIDAVREHTLMQDRELIDIHHAELQKAIDTGEQISDDVLRDYPDLFIAKEEPTPPPASIWENTEEVSTLMEGQPGQGALFGEETAGFGLEAPKGKLETFRPEQQQDTLFGMGEYIARPEIQARQVPETEDFGPLFARPEEPEAPVPEVRTVEGTDIKYEIEGLANEPVAPPQLKPREQQTVDDFRIGDIVNYQGNVLEVGFVQGGRLRLQNPETHEGSILASPTEVYKMVQPKPEAPVRAAIKPLDIFEVSGRRYQMKTPDYPGKVAADDLTGAYPIARVWMSVEDFERSTGLKLDPEIWKPRDETTAFQAAVRQMLVDYWTDFPTSPRDLAGDIFKVRDIPGYGRMNISEVKAKAGGDIDAIKAIVDEAYAQTHTPQPPISEPIRIQDGAIPFAQKLYLLFRGTDIETAFKTPRQFETWAQREMGLDLNDEKNLNLAYDSLEGAFNLLARDVRANLDARNAPLVERIKALDELENKLIRARRTVSKLQLQQFSTPLPISEAAGYAADIRPGDIIVEPNAGTGNLIDRFYSNPDVVVLTNEIDEGRRQVLSALGYNPTDMDVLGSEWVLGPDGRLLPPLGNVFIINPPWGAYSAGKYGTPVNVPVKMNDWSQRFAYLTLRRMPEGGRLVAVMPTNWLYTMDRATREITPFRSEFLRWLEENYWVRAIIESPPDAYKNRGTDIGSLLVVVDKVKTPPYKGKSTLEYWGPIAPKTWDEYADLVKRLGDYGSHSRQATDIATGRDAIRSAYDNLVNARRPASGPDATGLADPNARAGRPEPDPGRIGEPGVFRPRPGEGIVTEGTGPGRTPIERVPGGEPGVQQQPGEGYVGATAPIGEPPPGAGLVEGEPAGVPGPVPGEVRTDIGRGPGVTEPELRPPAQERVGPGGEPAERYVESAQDIERRKAATSTVEQAGGFTLYVARSPLGADEPRIPHPSTKDTQTGEYASGLIVPPTRIERIAKDFGQMVGVSRTPETALMDIKAGDRIPIRGYDGAEWELYLGSGGARADKIVIDGARMAQRTPLMNNGALYDARGSFFYIPEENLPDFIKRFPLRENAGLAQQMPPGRTYAFGPSGQRYNFKYRVVPLDDLISSHTDTFDINPRYPKELQPRNRDRAVYREQVQQIASGLDERALIDTHLVDSGTPITGPDMVVENGNGRVMAFRRARMDYPEQWQVYQQMLRDRLAEYGLDEADLSGVQDPVLVRERMDDVDRVQFANEAQASQSMQLTVDELATTDAQYVDDAALANLVVGGDQSVEGALRSQANRDIVNAFLARVPAGEKSTFLAPDGSLSLDGLTRLRNAIFAHVYPGDAGHRLSQAFLLSQSEAIANIRSALFDTLGIMSQAEALIREGRRSADLSITDDIARAVDVYARLKQQGMSVSDYVGQGSLFERELNPFQEALLQYFAENSRSRKRLDALVASYADDVVNVQQDPAQMSMFAEARATKGEILDAVAAQLGQDTSFADVEARPAAPQPEMAVEPGAVPMQEYIDYYQTELDHLLKHYPGTDDPEIQRRIAFLQQKIAERSGAAATPEPERLATPDDEPMVAARAPVGTADQYQEPPIEEAALESWMRDVEPALARAETAMMDPKNRRQGVAGYDRDLDPATKKELRKYLGQVHADMTDAKMATIRYGESRRDFALLNYGKRTGMDDAVSAVLPYEFWYTRSLLNWMLRAVDKPQIMANWARLRQFQERLKEQMGPTRLKKKVRIPLPFLPDWMGDGIYVDPLRQLFPIETLARPFETLGEQRTMELRRTQGILEQMVQDEDITEDQARQAWQSRSGSVWEQAYAQARNEIDGDISNPLDFAFTMSSPNLPISIAANWMSGHKDRISQLPITRLIQANTAALGIGGPRGVNIEKGIRKTVGLPEVDRYEDYRVDRMLSILAADGVITPDEAIRGMMDRQGPAFEQAQRRVSQMGMFQYWGAPMGVDMFPEGERELRQIKTEYDKARQKWTAGDDKALTKFFDDYPEYETRLASFREPEDRLRRYLISDVWDRYMTLPDIHRKQVREQLGDTFRNAFLNKDTRSYDSINSQTLATWAQVLGAENPKSAPEATQINLQLAPPEVAQQAQDYYDALDKEYPLAGKVINLMYQMPEAQRDVFAANYQDKIDEYYRFKNKYLADHPDIIPWVTSEKSELYGLPQDVQAYVYGYRARLDEMYPGIYDTQNAYYDQNSSSAKKKFLKAHPELEQFWQWRREVAAMYPAAAPYILSDTTLQKAILGDEYRAAQPMLTMADLNALSPNLLMALQANVFTGAELRAGAWTELERVWEQMGKPYGDLETWVSKAVKPAIRQQ